MELKKRGRPKGCTKYGEDTALIRIPVSKIPTVIEWLGKLAAAHYEGRVANKSPTTIPILPLAKTDKRQGQP